MFLTSLFACGTIYHPEASTDTALRIADEDRDGDSYYASADCDDGDPSVFPGAEEACNGIDDDCDGIIDDGLPARDWPVDEDGDGFGGVDTMSACAPPPGAASTGGDCDDESAEVHPQAYDDCDGVDNDCDGALDDDARWGNWYPDADEDGFGSDESVRACDPPAGFVQTPGDCDDQNPEASPDQVEVCGDGFDNDCDEATSCRLEGAMGIDSADENLWSDQHAALGLSAAMVDLDGDGLVDPVLGADGSDGGAVVMGFVGGLPHDDSAPDFTIDGHRLFQGEVALASGDLDGDGFSDLVVGAPEAGLDDSGAVALVFGPLVGEFLAEDLEDTQALLPGRLDELGMHVAVLGDLNDDGGLDWAASNAASTVFLMSGATGEISVDDAFATISGSEFSGGEVLMEGGSDLTGDGVADLVLGLPGASVDVPFEGLVAVLEGPLEGQISVDDATMAWRGDSGMARLGSALVADADFNGDGAVDLAMSAPRLDDRGAVAVVTSMTPGDHVMEDAEVVWAGWEDKGAVGTTLAAGDFDADGHDDLVVGAPAMDGGQVMVGYGPLVVVGDLSHLDAHLLGETGELLGSSLAVGDVHGDGWDDLLVGAAARGSLGTDAGGASLWFGMGL